MYEWITRAGKSACQRPRKTLSHRLTDLIHWFILNVFFYLFKISLEVFEPQEGVLTIWHWREWFLQRYIQCFNTHPRCNDTKTMLIMENNVSLMAGVSTVCSYNATELSYQHFLVIFIFTLTLWSSSALWEHKSEFFLCSSTHSGFCSWHRTRTVTCFVK